MMLQSPSICNGPDQDSPIRAGRYGVNTPFPPRMESDRMSDMKTERCPANPNGRAMNAAQTTAETTLGEFIMSTYDAWGELGPGVVLRFVPDAGLVVIKITRMKPPLAGEDTNRLRGAASGKIRELELT